MRIWNNTLSLCVIHTSAILSYLWGFETVKIAAKELIGCIRFYRTYEDLKHRKRWWCCPCPTQDFIVPMRIWNSGQVQQARYDQLRFYRTYEDLKQLTFAFVAVVVAVILSYLWGFETCPSHDHIRSYPHIVLRFYRTYEDLKPV